MVTKITTNNDNKYQALFKKAWDELYYRNKFNDDELKYYKSLKNTFTTLEDYFTHIQDLVTIDINEEYPDKIRECGEDGKTITEIDSSRAGQIIPFYYEFVMLPIDEPRLDINADTRDIDIPAGFKKLVGVQGDHLSETLIFSIDRFFDYVDMYGQEMNIYIQWKDKNGKDNASEIPFKSRCYDPVSQKVLFGWTLSDKLTATVGQVQFSVRFFQGKPDNITYSFNTKPHTITIASALQSSLKDLELENVSDMFLNIIKNSQTTDAPPARIPSFAAPGVDLEDREYDIVNEKDKILSVQAVVDGLGSLEYERWEYVNEDGQLTSINGILNYKQIDEIIEGRKYYKSTGNNIYTESLSPEEDLAAGEILYECYYELPLSEGKVSGQYSTKVRNRSGRSLSDAIQTKTANFPGPGEIKFNTNVDIDISKDSTETPAVLIASIDKNDRTNIKYQWQYSSSSPNGGFEDMVSTGTSGEQFTNDLVFSTEEPGWYRVNVVGLRNGSETEVLTSNICRVTNPPIIPTLKEEYKHNKDIIYNDIQGGQIQEIKIELDPTFDINNRLISDGIICQWYGALSDQEAILITKENRETYRVAEDSSINDLALKVVGGTSAISYYCRVFNTLANKQSVDDTQNNNNQSCTFVVL